MNQRPHDGPERAQMLGVEPTSVSERYVEARQRRRCALSGPPEGRHGIDPSASSRPLEGSSRPGSRGRS